MAEQYRFFDHIDGDRLYNADEFAEYFRQVLTSGVLNGGTNLQVYCNGADRIARIKAGKAWLEGYFYKLTEELELQLDEAHGTYDRIDRIVLRLDKNPQSRYIKAFVKTGVPAMAPVAPELTRDGLVYEISLAQILVVHNTTVIPANKVTDERLDASVCGLVNSLIQVDTATMQAEFDAFMATLAGQGYATVTDLQTLLEALNSHKDDNTKHITSTERNAWNGKIDKSLATAADQVMVSNGVGAWAVKTLAQLRAWLGLGSAAYLNTGTAANTVAVGNHNHSGTYEPADSNIMKKNVAQTMTAQFVAQNNINYTTKQVRNIILSTADPSGTPENGDIWIKYKA